MAGLTIQIVCNKNKYDRNLTKKFRRKNAKPGTEAVYVVGGRPLTGSLGGDSPPLEKLEAQEERACTYSPVILIFKNRFLKNTAKKDQIIIEKN